MNLTIDNNKPLQEGINQVIIDEEKFILSTINGDLGIHEKIHEVRKSLKKLRAAVRLVRKSTTRYSEENVFYRDLGRIISELRDKTALIESLDNLLNGYSGYLYARTFQRFRKILLQERQKRFESAYENEDPLEIIAHQIQKHMDQFEAFGINSFEDIKPGLRKVYKRGVRALHEVQAHPDTEKFHEWRKRTKYLRYQLEMLMNAWPHMLSAWEETLHTLSDLLGDDHDLAILSAKASDYRDSGFTDDHEWYLINALIRYERSKLQEKSIELGSKIYHDDPDTFSDRIEGFWKK